jgi:sugar lactone lactonase YvrE
MTMRPPRRLLATAKIAAVVLTSAALTVTLAGPVAAHPHRDSDRGSRPERIALPNGFQPEGIAIDKGSRAYLGSRTNGDIISVNLRTGKRRLVSEGEGPGNPSVGLKVDNGLIYVARGTTGSGQVISARTGKVLNTFQFFKDPSEANPTFVNDVVLTRNRAWFTDSRNPQLYSVTRTKNPARASFTTLPLTGDWVQAPPGNNSANGIVQSPDKRSLLVINSFNGLLYRVNPQTGVARVVDLRGLVLTNGDGLLLRGRTLYVVQNRLNQVAVLRLNYSGSQGRLVDTLTSVDLRRRATFDIPTTAAFYRGSLYLPNARFGVDQADTTARYWISRLRV